MNRPHRPLVLFTETASWRKATTRALDDVKANEETDRKIAGALARLTRAYALPTDKERRR